MLSLWVFITFLNLIPIHFARLMESHADLLQHYASELNMNSDLEQQLKSKLAQKKEIQEKLLKLNKEIAKDTEYFEEIPHFTANSFKSIRGKKSNIEHAFRNIIGMVGVKYTYKRDLHWRTWREVSYPNKKKEVICYRCQNIVDFGETNCTDCHQGGYWNIEEEQPRCSYEIFSFKNNDELCVAYFWQLNKANLSSCPNVLPLNDILSCGFPMITKYLVNVDYSKNVSERTLPAICNRREQCEFSTVYVVNPENVVFRIINTTNNIVYSKIMKKNKKQYVCVDNCGIFNFDTVTATRKEDHLILNLLQSKKKKRDNPRLKKEDIFTRQKIKNKVKSKKYAFLKKELVETKHNDNSEKPDTELRSTTRGPSKCKKILLQQLFRDCDD